MSEKINLMNNLEDNEVDNYAKELVLLTMISSRIDLTNEWLGRINTGIIEIIVGLGKLLSGDEKSMLKTVKNDDPSLTVKGFPLPTDSKPADTPKEVIESLNVAIVFDYSDKAYQLRNDKNQYCFIPKSVIDKIEGNRIFLTAKAKHWWKPEWKDEKRG